MVKQTGQLPLVLTFSADTQQLTLLSGGAYEELRPTPPALLMSELKV